MMRDGRELDISSNAVARMRTDATKPARLERNEWRYVWDHEQVMSERIAQSIVRRPKTVLVSKSWIHMIPTQKAPAAGRGSHGNVPHVLCKEMEVSQTQDRSVMSVPA